jgi:adenylate cyclase
MFSGPLFRKYFALILAVVWGTQLISGAIGLFLSYRSNKSIFAAVQREKALAATYRIEQFVRQIEQQLVYAALPQPGQGNEEVVQRRVAFIKLLRQAPAVSEARQLDAHGREVLKVSRLGVDAVGSMEDHSRDPAYAGAQSGRTWYGPVYFKKETEPYMLIATRSAVGAGTVTLAEVNLKFIWDVVTQIEISDRGRVYVVDDKGQLVADPDIGRVLGKTDMSGLDQVRHALTADQAAEAPLIIARDYVGTEVLSTFASIEPLGWKVFVEQPVAEVYATLYAPVLWTAALMLAGLIISSFTALWLARGLVRPIRTLQKGAQKIGAGHLDQQIEVKTGDELEALADQFNTMALRLRESYSGLERKVEERTAEVQRQARELTEWNRTLESRVAEGVRELEHIGRLKRFLSPQITDLIVSGATDDPLKSHRREITVVFLDLRGFTAFTEAAEPEEVMSVLQEYHDEMGRLIMQYSGTIEHFAGDGIMIVFNDPVVIDNPARQAVSMAVAMQSSFVHLSRNWGRRGYELGMGIGIAQGYATIGVIGFEDRRDYTAIGAVCNQASRLCGEAANGQILVAQKIFTLTEDFVVAEAVGGLSLKGFHRPVLAYNVKGLREQIVRP